MKKHINIIMIAALLICSITSCKKDKVDPPTAPTISNIEFGHNNNKTGYIGADLHVEAEIKAPGKIDNIKVELHPENFNGWEYSKVFKENFDGLLNATFHKHLPVSAGAIPGAYHLHFTVTDKNGMQTTVESGINIVSDPSLPSVSGYTISVTNGGNTLHVEAEISAPNKIAEVKVEIHGSWEDEVEYNDAVMVGETSYHLLKNIDISAASLGHYHVHLAITDQAGGNVEFEEHFNK